MRFFPFLLVLLTVLTLAAPAPLCAQESAGLRPGDRVRVEASQQSGTFLVTVLADEELVLEDTDGREVRVPHASLSRLLVDRGPRSRGSGALRGLAIGGGAGVLAGAVIGFADGDDDCPSDSWCLFQMTAGEKASIGAVVFGLVGGVVGATLGAGNPGHRWEALRLPLTMNGGAGAAGGFRLGVSLSV